MLTIADTHGYLNLDNKEEELRKYKNSNYDLCCLLGDITYSDIEAILKYVPKDKIVGILGNHDGFDLLSHYGIKDINGKLININGIRLAGMQGSYRYKTENFPSFTQKESIEFADKLPTADILLSHSGPYYKYNKNVVHNGLQGITYYLYKNHVPYNIHGHLHINENKTLLNGTNDISVFVINLIEL